MGISGSNKKETSRSPSHTLFSVIGSPMLLLLLLPLPLSRLPKKRNKYGSSAGQEDWQTHLEVRCVVLRKYLGKNPQMLHETALFPYIYHKFKPNVGPIPVPWSIWDLLKCPCNRIGPVMVIQ